METVALGLSFVTAVSAPAVRFCVLQVTAESQVEAYKGIEQEEEEATEPVGGGTPTETVTVALALPPVPVQLKLKEVVDNKGLIVWLPPETAFAPDHLPSALLAVQEVAQEMGAQVRVVDPL